VESAIWGLIGTLVGAFASIATTWLGLVNKQAERSPGPNAVVPVAMELMMIDMNRVEIGIADHDAFGV
jgi:hypothetical protein